jgi:ParB family chromosome partitioning protein
MAKALPKITLSLPSDVPLDKLVLSQSNARRVENGVTIEYLADSIARRGPSRPQCPAPVRRRRAP